MNLREINRKQDFADEILMLFRAFLFLHYCLYKTSLVTLRFYMLNKTATEL